VPLFCHGGKGSSSTCCHLFQTTPRSPTPLGPFRFFPTFAMGGFFLNGGRIDFSSLEFQEFSSSASSFLVSRSLIPLFRASGALASRPLYRVKEIIIIRYRRPIPLYCTSRYQIPWYDHPVRNTQRHTKTTHCLHVFRLPGPHHHRPTVPTFRLLVAGIETFKMRVPLQQQMLQFHVTLFQIIVDQYFVKISGPCPVFNFSDGVF
jgi:hypothetical protein